MLQFKKNPLICGGVSAFSIVVMLLSVVLIGVGSAGLAKRKLEVSTYGKGMCNVTNCQSLGKVACTCKDCVDGPCTKYNLTLSCYSQCDHGNFNVQDTYEFETGFNCKVSQLEGFYSCLNAKGTFSIYPEGTNISGWVTVVIIFTLSFILSLAMLIFCIWPISNEYQTL